MFESNECLVCTFWWPGAHILGHDVHPAGACFFIILNITIQNELMEEQSGTCFLKATHPVGAQNKTLKSGARQK